MYYVYIVECRDGKYYVGFTNNPERRLNEHNSGKNKTAFTYPRRPVVLVYCEVFNDVHQAIEWEKQLKGWSRAKKKAVIDGDWHLLPELARNRQG